METRLLRAQRAELPFTLQVPDKARGAGLHSGGQRGCSWWRPAQCGARSARTQACRSTSNFSPRSNPAHQPPQGTVCGVLWYFPFQDGQETVPLENPATTAKPASSPYAPGRATQHAPGFSQLPRATQAAPRATQAPGGAGAAGAGGLEGDDDDEGAGAWQAAPIFEAFWQGRLIPGGACACWAAALPLSVLLPSCPSAAAAAMAALPLLPLSAAHPHLILNHPPVAGLPAAARIVTLPFLEAVRTKRSAQAKVRPGGRGSQRLRAEGCVLQGVPAELCGARAEGH